MTILESHHCNADDFRMPMTVIGLGNEFLTDDGVGIRVVRMLRESVRPDSVVFEELAVGGLQLLDYIVNFERCIIVDAIVTGQHAAGTLYKFDMSPGEHRMSLRSSHQIDLGQVLELGRLMGASLPSKLTVYGVEVADTTTFSETCTDLVERAIPLLAEKIRRDMVGSSNTVGDTSEQWLEIDQEASIS